MSIKLAAVVVVLPLLLSSCASYRNYSRGEECEKSIKDYSKMVRWGELETAVLSVVDKGQREAYAVTAESVRRRGLTMVDVRILAQQCRGEQGSAEATLEFDYFAMPDNRLKTVTDRQRWIYREEQPNDPDKVSGWKLTTPPPIFK
ncbi:MAG: hypothetical protein WBI04_01390 [Trichlorobacter sp.]|jgi:hypothetical protein